MASEQLPEGEASERARAALSARLATLEAETRAAHAALAALGPGQVSGLHLAVEVAGHRALLPAGGLREVVPLVALRPLPGAPPQVAGTFVLRGEPVTVLDLARCLGVAREPALEAQILVVGAVGAVGLLVDHVLAVEERILLLERAAAPAPGDPFGAARLVAARCRWRDEAVPLLDLARVLGAVEGPP